MTMQRKIGAAIVLIAAMAAGTGLVGHLNIKPAAGAAVIGIVIGMGVALGMFSTTRNSTK